MSSVALKRGAAAPRSRPTRRKPASVTVALPISAARLRRNVIVALALLLLLVGVVAAGLAGVPARIWQALVLRSAAAGFEIHHVDIAGNHEVAKLPIYAAALPGGDNAMLTTDLAAIRERLKAIDWVADASVSRRLPDTLDISIVERRPAALWQLGGKTAVIDITGKVLTRDRLDRFAGLPLIVDVGAATHVRELLTMVAEAPELHRQISAAIRIGDHRWNLKFKTGETLVLPDRPAAARAAYLRFAALNANLPDDKKLLGGHFERFDMRLPGRMIVGGPAVKMALDAAAKAAKAPKPTTI